MSKFSRRVDVQIIKDVPLSYDAWLDRDDETPTPGAEPTDTAESLYRKYLDRFQPYRWRAVAANNEPIAHGESYFNLDDCLNAIDLLLGDNTTVYYAPMFGEDRGFKWLRYGKTDRDAQAAQ